MKTIIFILLFAISCIYPKDITISSKDADMIAHRIWINEGEGKKKYLVWWNRGEEFASLGIGHFIWFTADKPMWFFHAFPDMLRYITVHGAKPPKWLTPDSKCIWNSYEEWKRAKSKNSPKMRELTEFLYRTRALQAQYMVHRLTITYPKLLKYAPSRKTKQKIALNFNRLLYKNGKIDPQGAYILIDYLNFKGDGTLESERYQGKGWGLYQVLLHMDTKGDPYRAFADSARFILDRLIRVSPPERRLKRFRRGWFNRIKSYENGNW